MSDSIELTVDGTTLIGGAVGAVIATLWSTAPVFLSGPTVAAITRNQTPLIVLGIAITAGTVLYKYRFNGGSTPKTAIYTGIAAFLLVGAVGYAALPVAATLQGQDGSTGRLTGDNLRVATLQVDGMVCQGCKMTVENYLDSMDGTERVSADMSSQRVTVVYDAETLAADQLQDADVFRGPYDASIADDRRYQG